MLSDIDQRFQKNLYFVVLVLKNAAIMPMLRLIGSIVIHTLFGYIYHEHYQNLIPYLRIIHVTSPTHQLILTITQNTFML